MSDASLTPSCKLLVPDDFKVFQEVSQASERSNPNIVKPSHQQGNLTHPTWQPALPTVPTSARYLLLLLHIDIISVVFCILAIHSTLCLVVIYLIIILKNHVTLLTNCNFIVRATNQRNRRKGESRTKTETENGMKATEEVGMAVVTVVGWTGKAEEMVKGLQRHGLLKIRHNGEVRVLKQMRRSLLISSQTRV